MDNSNQVVIVGGGLAGLCCAKALHGHGVDFVLLEANDRWGGRVRTESKDGFRLDVGFQVLLTSYPEAKQNLDYESLRLGKFLPGALIRFNGRLFPFVDPWRSPIAALKSAFAPVATLGDKLKVAKLRSRVKRSELDNLVAGEEVSTLQRLQQLGFSSKIIESFFRPFMGGVFLEHKLSTSAHKFEYLFRLFSDGHAALPAGGMSAIPEQIAKSLPANRLRCGSQVVSVERQRVTLQSGESINASQVIVACDPWNAARLLNEPPPASNSTGVVYYGCAKPPISTPILVLNGEGQGIINSLCVPSLVSQNYAPQGEHLISVTVRDVDDTDHESQIRSQLNGWFGEEVRTWRHLASFKVPQALPRQEQMPKSLTAREYAIRRPDGLILCGDYLDLASIQGAMRSGRVAAELALQGR